MGKERASSAVRDRVAELLSRFHNDFVYDNEKFYSPALKSAKRIRKAGDRKITQISIEELKAGIKRVVFCQKRIGFTKEGLIRETLKAFGFQKLTGTVSARMEQAFNQLVESGQLEINEAGHVSVKE